jgi:hypothetical protein
MADINDGGAAFPMLDMLDKSRNHAERWEAYTVGGMSLRDYFAAQALPAVIETYERANGPCLGTDHIVRNVPAIAYKLADAMLKAREES